MPRISFVKNKAPIEVSSGANLMQSLLSADIPVASSCHGEGVCRKCVITIEKGLENLTPPTSTEIELGERNPISANQRISCQTYISGDILIDTGYW